MDGLVLLRRAREAGLAVEAEGGKLVIRGPKRAEPVARLLIEHKPEILAALVPANDVPAPVRAAHETAAEWRAQHREALTQSGTLHPDDEAARLAMGAMEVRWNMRHGERVPPNLCAGCRRPIGGAEALDLIDGCRVHDRADNGCLIRHGERWRAAATRAMAAMGLQLPSGAP